MFLLRIFTAAFFGFTLNSCGNLNPRKADALPRGDAFHRNAGAALEFYPEEESGLSYANGDSSSDAWIFLIAGSLRGANFAQEVVDQRRLWLERGAQPREIACYFVIPDKEHFDQDAEQYRKIGPELRACKLASFKVIAADLARSASTKKKDLYIYITSHGDRPLSYYGASSESQEEKAKFDWLVTKYPFLDRYMLALDATPEGTANIDGQLDAVDQGTAPDYVFLTPQNFKAALENFGPDTKKTVVLQGCFTGGFISDGRPEAREHLLSTINNITVITAARSDRPSFGCGLGDERTFFGGALLEALEASDTYLPHELNWADIFTTTVSTVAHLETEHGYNPSEPSWFSNR